MGRNDAKELRDMERQMEMDDFGIHEGDAVRVHDLGPAGSAAGREGQTGTVTGYCSSADGDYFVRFSDGTEAEFCASALEVIEPAPRQDA